MARRVSHPENLLQGQTYRAVCRDGHVDMGRFIRLDVAAHRLHVVLQAPALQDHIPEEVWLPWYDLQYICEA